MGTIAEQINYLADTKTAIKEALVAKGVNVGETDTFRSYADKIASIETGGGGSAEDTITYWDIAGDLESLAELILWAYLVKGESTSRGKFINPIGMYYIQGGGTDQVSPQAIALDVNRVVLVENNTPQSLYDILGTDDLTQFGAIKLSKEEFYSIN